ncbi:MAG: DUF2079 domain-containing protein, partial [Clostridia bacterium]|nr:DUF2079 domain-containing protein [Clostridia bacterium]
YVGMAVLLAVIVLSLTMDSYLIPFFFLASIGVAIMLFIACRWIFSRFETPFSKFKLNYGVVLFIVVVMFVYFVGYMSLMGICRYYSFTYDAFDFGIFAQMFDYMKNTGIPYTTVERNQFLSHFAVHFSPFFYILLPGYMVFSTPAYLCVAQTLFIGVSVFAVYGIAKTLGFSPKQTLLACSMYLLYPAFSYGLYFDFHENKFLTFCILFAVYFLLKRKFIPFYVFAILLCTVKEDAAIYLVAIALFMLLRERLIKHGLLTLVLALGYFVFALKMVELCGATEENQFGYRYGNFALNGESTIGNIIKITVLDFGYTLNQMFVQEKIEFLLWMFLPVLFLPFLNKKVSTLVLFAPMVLVNFMTSWPYQHHVDYQYTFGTGAMIIVCTLLAISEMGPKQRNAAFTSVVALSLVLTVPRVINRNQVFISGYTSNQATFQSSMKFIDDNLRREHVIGVEGNVMPMLYDYPFLVLDPHDDALAGKIEYYVAKKDDGDIVELTNRGFELTADNGYIVIYKNPAYQAK